MNKAQVRHTQKLRCILAPDGGNSGGSHPGYNTDVMGVYAGYQGNLTMNQTHWNSWGDYITKNGVESGDIMNVVVDRNPATQTLRQQ